MYIEVICSSDQGLEGVVRISEVTVDANDLCDVDYVEKEIINKLAEKEYFTEDSNWSNEVKSDIANVTGCSINNIDVY